MDKEPKRDEVEQDDIAEIRIQSVPLMVLVAGALSSVSFVD